MENINNNINNKNDDQGIPSGIGVDKQTAQRMAEESGADNPCGYCNRGDCIECRFSR